VLDLTAGTSTNFAALGGSPPTAKHVWRCNGFLFIGNTSTSELQWRHSDLESITNWTTGLASRQTTPDGGRLMGGVGNETIAYVGYEECIRLIRHLPGNRPAFSLQDITRDEGVTAPRSMVLAGGVLYYLSDDGFKRIDQQGTVESIGYEKVDRTLREYFDADSIYMVQGALDPYSHTVYWRGKTTGGTSYESDYIIGYNIRLGQWSAPITIPMTYLLTAATSGGTTLEDIDIEYPSDTLDTLPFSLDANFLRSGRIGLAAIDTDDRLGFFSGTALEATLDTPLMTLGGDGRRAFVRGFRPLIDASGVTATVLAQEAPGGDVTESVEFSQNGSGFIPTRASGRFVRMRCTIPAGTTWTHAQGLEGVETVTGGKL
jgi:hypothetical protein